MSLLADFGRGLLDIGLKKVARRAGVMPGAGPVMTTQPMQAQILPAALPPIVAGAGRVLTHPATRAGAAAAAGVIAGELFDDDGRRKRRRRIDYGNMKAARRAIRRIKGTRKLLQEIERQLPKRTVHRRTHAHRHSHTSRA